MRSLILSVLFWFVVFGAVVMEIAQRFVGSKTKLKDALVDEAKWRLEVLWILLTARSWLALATLALVILAAKALWP